MKTLNPILRASLKKGRILKAPELQGLEDIFCVNLKLSSPISYVTLFQSQN